MSSIQPTPRRGRPPGRSAYQEEKRRQTRASILAATADILVSTPYVYATIDDIVSLAGVSRATFYHHFESKFALAVAIYDGIAPDWLAHFDQLSARSDWDRPSLIAWIWQLADLYVAHGYVTPLVEQLVVFEEGFRARLARDREALIDRLGIAGIAGFAAASRLGHGDARHCARVRLFLQRLDQVCGMLARADYLSAENADAYMQVLAEELSACMKDPLAG